MLLSDVITRVNWLSWYSQGASKMGESKRRGGWRERKREREREWSNVNMSAIEIQCKKCGNIRGIH